MGHGNVVYTHKFFRLVRHRDVLFFSPCLFLRIYTVLSLGGGGGCDGCPTMTSYIPYIVWQFSWGSGGWGRYSGITERIADGKTPMLLLHTQGFGPYYLGIVVVVGYIKNFPSSPCALRLAPCPVAHPVRSFVFFLILFSCFVSQPCL